MQPMKRFILPQITVVDTDAVATIIAATVRKTHADAKIKSKGVDAMDANKIKHIPF